MQDANDQDDCNTAGTPTTSGNPIVLGTGNKVEHELDFASGGEMGLYLERTYNHLWTYRSLFGKHWLSNFDYTLVPQSGPNSAVIWAQRPDGRRIRFIKPQGENKWYEDKPGAIAYIEAAPPNTPGYVLHSEENTIERYNAYGYIQTVHNLHGVGWTYHYNGSGTLVLSISHTSGRSIQFKWVASHLTEVTDPQGAVYAYGYDPHAFGSGRHRLASVTRPGAPVTTVSYHYENASFPGALTGKSYNGVRYSTFAYQSNGRAILSEHAGGVDRHTYGYQLGAASPPSPDPVPPPPPPGGECDPVTLICHEPEAIGDPPAEAQANGALAAAADAQLAASYPDLIVTETNPLNKQAEYVFAGHKVASITGHPSPHCGARLRGIVYDANGYPDAVEDFNGHVANYDHNAKGQLIQVVEAVGTTVARTTAYAWHPTLNRLQSVTVTGDREESYAYHANGRLAQLTVKNLSANGTPNQTQATTYAYTHHPNGLVATLAINGPIPGSGDQVVYTYSIQGDLISVTNSLGHVTSYSQYNALGQPGRIVGPNGEAIEYQYDARGRTTRMRTFRNGGQQDTVYVYNGAGLLQSMTTPDGVTESYTYDNARRLKEINRNEPGGTAKRVLTYNTNSQVTREDIFRGNTLHYRAYTDYDELGRVRARRGNHGQNMRYGYDTNDNLTTITDSLNKITTLEYDARNRLIKQIDPLGGITRFSYDAGDRVRQVTDPRNLVTSYAYDGFGQLRTQTSPDSGTTTHTWDAGGLLTSTKRADNVTVSYGHDTLGRRTSATAGGQAHGITYDTCVNGKGRVCRLTDPGQTLDLSYTPYGDLAGKVPTIAGSPVNLGHGFQYDAQGRLSKIVYPNGVEATYTYTLDRVTSLTVKINGQTKTVANAIQYEPMGPFKQLAFGNGGGRIHYHDTDYRLTDIVTDLKVGYHFDVDANDRITGYTNFANGDWSYGFGHDELHRLKSASSPGLGSQSLTYDPNGNRKTQNATVYTIASGSNRLMSEGGRSYAYTLTGNVKTITGFGIGTGDDIFHNGFQIEQAPVTTFTYDPFDRLTGVSGPDISASYKRGPDGARYQKTANGETTRFVYGPNGMLLSEHRQTPARWTHYLWLNGQPVALVRNNTLYWIQTDHLGRPEGITNQARQRMWRAATMPFGRTVIDDVIGGFHLGFPGQYHDAETGFAYNIHRTYMPAVGRYLETDPIGLAGGINTYAYADGNPVNRIDPLGLCGMGAAFGAMAGNPTGDFTGLMVQAQAQQMQSQAERYAAEKTAEAGKEAGKCAAEKAAESLAVDFLRGKALDQLQNRLPSRLDSALLWGRVAWSYSGAGAIWTGIGVVGDVGACLNQAYEVTSGSY